MEKKKAVTIAIVILVCGLLVFLFANWYIQAKKPTPKEQAYEMMGRIEGALSEMDKDWKKQSVTEATPITYADDSGNTIVYYLCETTYFEAEPAEVAELNMEAVQCVIDPASADSSRSCDVNGLAAILYEMTDRFYLCWTISPEYTCILEYSPDAVTEEDIFKMAESVPVNTQN